VQNGGGEIKKVNNAKSELMHYHEFENQEAVILCHSSIVPNIVFSQ